MQVEKLPDHLTGSEVAVIDLAGCFVAQAKGAGGVGYDLVCGHLSVSVSDEIDICAQRG
jgi:hypothetical protein